MRNKLVVGNWKMHGRLETNRALLQGLSDSAALTCAVAVCVPFPYLEQARTILQSTPVAWGAQNCSQHKQGAYTGEVSAEMLADFGCRYVLVGHSERRALYGETNGDVANKFQAALAQGLTPVLCVGETLAEREAGETLTVIDAQLDAVTALCGIDAMARAVVAYEPVWAIGTGRTASPQQAQEVHAHIRARVAEANGSVGEALQILYGGSVKPQNAAELFSQADIDGGLIGGASLVLDDFLHICRSAN